MKKVLIVTYYWPPSGGGGVQRWLKFTKYLPQYGWEPIVVIPQGAEYPNTDLSLTKEISDTLQIIEIPIWEPYHLFKKVTGKKEDEKVNSGFLFDDTKQSFTQKASLWIRGNVLIPDPRLFWVNPAVKALSKVIKEQAPDIIITTGPPHSLHLIGLKLQRKFKIKWVADFRDPWSTIDYLDKFYLTKWARNRHRSLEKRVLKNANKTLAVSSQWEKELISLGATSTAVITNGFDESDFANYTPAAPNGFKITHTGFISSLRNPNALWQALQNTCMKNPQLANKLSLQFVGNVDNGVFASIDQHKALKTKVDFKGYVPHTEVFNFYKNTTVLLLLLNNSGNSSGHIPGKLFEYLGTGKPILALGEKGGDVDLILQETGAGKLFDFEDSEGIQNYLEELYFSEEDLKTELTSINHYSRKYLTKKLSNVLNNL